MKFKHLLIAFLILAFGVVTNAKKNEDKNVEKREPAQTHQDVVRLASMIPGSFSKFTDPQTGVICYVASLSTGGVAMQCFKKDE
jgi:hypothetical protein